MALNYEIQLAFNKYLTDNWSETDIWFSGMDFNTKEPKDFVRLLILENENIPTYSGGMEQVKGNCEIHIFNKMGENISRVQDLADMLQVLFDGADFDSGGLIIQCGSVKFKYIGNFAPRNAGVIDTIESGLILFNFNVYNQGEC